MIFADLISERRMSHPTKLSHQLSPDDKMQKNDNKLNHSNKHHRQNQKRKQLHMSVLDLLHWYRPADTLRNKNRNQQQPCLHRPSIIKSSDIPRTISKKSVTFASVSDLVDNEHDKDHMTINFEINPNNEMISEGEEEEDIVTVIPNKRYNDETMMDSSEPIEPYPFRSEIPLSLSPQLYSPIDVASTTHHSPKKIIHHFIHHRRPKKLRHPIKTIDPVITMNRSTSAPNLLTSSPLFLPPTTAVQTNHQQSPFKTIRTWFELSSVRRFTQSFGKTSNQNQNNISKTKIKTHPPSSGLQRFSQFVY